tara:strand:+ start:421 stop:555 length:135 start_codon:yes stop_codon:yes gene_type:complete
MKKLHEVGKIVAQIKSYRQRLWLKLKACLREKIVIPFLEFPQNI